MRSENRIHYASRERNVIPAQDLRHERHEDLMSISNLYFDAVSLTINRIITGRASSNSINADRYSDLSAGNQRIKVQR